MNNIKNFIDENKHEDTFVLMMLKLIDKLGFTEKDIQNKTGLDHKYFWKLKNNINYKPSKKNACAIALALELDNETAKQLIKRAGYILTAAKKYDLIIRYCFENNIYDLFEVNELLEQQGITKNLFFT